MHLVYEHTVYKFVDPRKYPSCRVMWMIQFARYSYILISTDGVTSNPIETLVGVRHPG